MIKKLGFKYLSKINNVILVYPTFLNKSWGYLSAFGFKDGFYNKYLTYSASISDLIILLGPLFDYKKLDKSLFSK